MRCRPEAALNHHAIVPAMPIELLAYDPKWQGRYEQLVDALRRELQSVAVRIDHIGSTSVPGLAAKDVIDLQIAVAALEPHGPYREALERLGYHYRPDKDLGHRFFKLDSAAGRRLANVHVCVAGSGWESDHLGFRDSLREDALVARRYEEVKQVLARQFDDANEFAQAKSAFIQNILAQRVPAAVRRSPILDTDRLHLREYTHADLDQTARLLGDPLAMQYYRATKTREESLAWIDWNLANYREFGFGLWAIELQRTGEFVGDCGLTLQEIAGRKDVELGYHVRRELWGRGFATEAAAACRDYARDYLRLRRLIAIIHPDNAASRAVARKIGMSPEGEYARKGRAKVVYAMALAPSSRGSLEAEGLR